MIDTAALRQNAHELRSYAQQIRRDSATTSYPTAGMDASLLEQAAKLLEEAAVEIERLRSTNQNNNDTIDLRRIANTSLKADNDLHHRAADLPNH